MPEWTWVVIGGAATAFLAACTILGAADPAYRYARWLRHRWRMRTRVSVLGLADESGSPLPSEPDGRLWPTDLVWRVLAIESLPSISRVAFGTRVVVVDGRQRQFEMAPGRWPRRRVRHLLARHGISPEGFALQHRTASLGCDLVIQPLRSADGFTDVVATLRLEVHVRPPVERGLLAEPRLEYRTGDVAENARPALESLLRDELAHTRLRRPRELTAAPGPMGVGLVGQRLSLDAVDVAVTTCRYSSRQREAYEQRLLANVKAWQDADSQRGRPAR